MTKAAASDQHPTLPPVPDFLGQAQRVQTVSDMLEGAQSQLQTFHSMRVVNGHELTDVLPGTKPEVTYGDRIEQLEDGIAALMGESADIQDELIAEALKRRKARERALEA